MQPPLATVDVDDSLDQVFADLSGGRTPRSSSRAAGRPTGDPDAIRSPGLPRAPALAGERGVAVLRLYDFAASANCYKVRLLAAQLGLEFERVPVDLFAGESQTPEHMARNPAGRTPVLELESGRAPCRIGRDPSLSRRGHATPSGRQARPGACRAVALLRAEPARAEHRHRPLLDPDRPRGGPRAARRALAEGRQAFARRPRAAPACERLPPWRGLLRCGHRPLRLHPSRG